MSTTPAAPPFTRVVLLHGFGAHTANHWFPWLARQVPVLDRVELPDPQAPDAESWIALAAAAIGPLDERTALITHSLGGVTGIRALQRLAAADPGGSRLGALVAVAPFTEQLPLSGDPELDAFVRDLAPAFTDGADPAAVAGRIARATVIRSDDDPAVPAWASDHLASALGADLVVVPGAGHFLGSGGILELPEVLTALGDGRG